MELRQLRYFVAVAATENVSRAAQKLNVVQSAVSRQIRELERDLGCDLFDRIGRRVQLSSFGVQFLVQAQRILAEVEMAKARAGMIAKGQAGRLQVAVQVAAFDRPIALKSIKLFKSENPEVDLSLVPMNGEQVLDALRAGTVDGGFVFAPMEHSEVLHEHLSNEQWLLSMPRSHRLAEKRDIVLSDLADEPFIWLPRHVSPMLHDKMLAACYNGGLVPNIVQVATDRILLLGLIEVGIGLCFLPGPINEERSKEIVQRRVLDFSLPADASFVWKKGTGSPIRERLLETIKRIKSDSSP